MSLKYSHLLSPLKIGNIVFKNRMIHAKALPHFLQGPETFPSEAVMSFYASVAKSAAIVTCPHRWDLTKPRNERYGDLAHMPMFDSDDPAVHNYLSMLADTIHFYDARASFSLMGIREPEGYNISDVPPDTNLFHVKPGKEISTDLLEKIIDDAVGQCRLFQSLGYDMANVYMSYRNSILAYSLSPEINKRKDKYGGNFENRGRFALELFQAIKKACGKDFIIEAQVSGEEAGNGYKLEDMVQYAKLWEGSLDILQLRAPDASAAHPIGFNSQKKYPLTLHYAEILKKAGIKMIIAPIGGFQDLDMNEEYIATGKADMIAMARAFIVDPDYGKKAYEGRGEDVFPCIRCNKCHGTSMTGPWYSVCSVNPRMGITRDVNRMIEPAGGAKKVAVIGGGPAGMKAALVAAERGHKVTLYEKNYYLGGQLRHADYSSFKWPLRDFKDWLIRQLNKSDIEILLSTQATPEIIKSRGYEAVIVAMGAEPLLPNIPGADEKNVWSPISVYGHEKELGRNLVVVGGSETGTETGMYLALAGHNVVVLTRQKKLAYDATPIHYLEIVRDSWESLKNFSYLTESTTAAICSDHVDYTDCQGNLKSIPVDDVVLCGGMRPLQEEALRFYDCADRFFIIGDCRAVGNVQKCMRTAFATASLI